MGLRTKMGARAFAARSSILRLCWQESDLAPA
jgi:hypothetical protein